MPQMDSFGAPVTGGNPLNAVRMPPQGMRPRPPMRPMMRPPMRRPPIPNEEELMIGPSDMTGIRFR